MNNQTLFIKVKQRINKLASNDFDNIQPWQFIEAYTKAEVEWCRRNLHGLNIPKEGDEQSTSRIDDLQVLITTTPEFTGATNENGYFQTAISQWPSDYLRFKRVILNAKKDCCEIPVRMTVYLVEEGNIDILIKDRNIKPSYDWEETIATLVGNTLKVYHNDDFDVDECRLQYYKSPRKIQMNGVADPYSGIVSIVEVESELPDHLIELVADDAAAILAGDVDNWGQMNRLNTNVEKNN